MSNERARAAKRVGRAVYCLLCERPKKPVGRDLAPAMSGSYCTHDECPGYDIEPWPDNLWPGEESDDQP